MNNFRRLFSFTRPAYLLRRRVLPMAIAGVGAYMLMQADGPSSLLKQVHLLTREFVTASTPTIMSANAETKYKCQDMVFREDKANGLFLIIHLKPNASPNDCIKALQKIQAHVDGISPPDIRDEDNEVIYGVAFGPSFLAKVYPDAEKNGVESFLLKERKGKSSYLPSTGGDILVHAVCGEKGKLFELAQAVLQDIPEKAIAKVEETYGFVYRNNRDLSGFIDGTENPAEEEERIGVAVSETTGGSYVLTQRWVHNMKLIASESQKVMEAKVGRTKPDSIEIKPIAPSSHVGRMVHGLSEEEGERLRIVRHSLPYGTVSGECGLLFIAYAKTPRTLDFMLDRMVGLSPDGVEDGIFHFTKALTGAYFYSPSRSELETIYKKFGSCGGPSSFWKR